jgi:hypothetical protein
MTDFVESAYLFDMRNKPAQAVEFYEKAISVDELDVPGYLNLMVLYFEMLDYGFCSSHQISQELSEIADSRLWQLNNEIKTKFGENDEAMFWETYSKFVVLGEDSSVYELIWLSFIDRQSTLVPLIYFFGREKVIAQYTEQIALLKVQCIEATSARERYILSILNCSQ